MAARGGMRLRRLAAGLLAMAGCIAAAPATAQAVAQVRDDRINHPLAAAGDPARGQAIAADRQQGLCLLCHSAPLADTRFQGNLAPSLAGAGTRYTEAQLRLRVVDIRRVHPDSLMPAFHSTDRLARVGTAWQGRTILTAQQVEDVVAWLATLR